MENHLDIIMDHIQRYSMINKDTLDIIITDSPDPVKKLLDIVKSLNLPRPLLFNALCELDFDYVNQYVEFVDSDLVVIKPKAINLPEDIMTMLRKYSKDIDLTIRCAVDPDQLLY